MLRAYGFILKLGANSAPFLRMLGNVARPGGVPTSVPGVNPGQVYSVVVRVINATDGEAWCNVRFLDPAGDNNVVTSGVSWVSCQTGTAPLADQYNYQMAGAPVIDMGLATIDPAGIDLYLHPRTQVDVTIMVKAGNSGRTIVTQPAQWGNVGFAGTLIQSYDWQGAAAAGGAPLGGAGGGLGAPGGIPGAP